jgi:TATA-box binding protein (TBP) (component of TFIID and TFIIIB)
MLEYGGWGIRCGWHGKKVYNISGNRGVQLVFKNGKRLLIGSQKPDDFANALNLMS